jgi:hypothetical protein
MKPFLSVAALALVTTVFLVACDQRGTMPVQQEVTGGGSTGGTTTGGGTKDTSQTGGTKDTLPTVVSVFDSSSLWGPTAPLTPGTSRMAVFFLTDPRKFHVATSSDGQPAGGVGPTEGRRTDWQIRLSSPDSIYGSWYQSTAENGLQDSIWNYVDSSIASHPHVVLVRSQNITGKTELSVTTDSGALVTVSVLAWSGVDDKTYGWTPPRLPNDTVSKLVYGGKTPAPIGSWAFQIQMPVAPKVGSAD